ncbi:methyltransferase domain-containing protein [Liquorilactobacillus sicerae]|uniref:methyltransferase domain-containing protein n=1 Tax=Liquorilactobacillus sicerae TaxID=1416943 RepID=UPI0024802C05|nr:methyltransferase domain-containing protein [Liquorilactobacillus sicerae]
MKKIELATVWLENNLDLFRCPDCQQPLCQIKGYSVACQQGHVFDLSRKGTLFLTRHHSANNYDDNKFWQARQRLLQHGLFDKIYARIGTLLPKKPLNILDAGCGQGAALNYLAQQRNFSDQLVGFDLSKKAINLATQINRPAFFCVADLAALPFTNQSFDVLLDIFTPSAYAEFQRVLRTKGLLIKVIPANDYLIELRHLLYEKNSVHYQYSNEKVRDLFLQHYPRARQIRINYQFPLKNTDFQDLLQMTPLQWGASQKQLLWAAGQDLPQITIDVDLLITNFN